MSPWARRAPRRIRGEGLPDFAGTTHSREGLPPPTGGRSVTASACEERGVAVSCPANRGRVWGHPGGQWWVRAGASGGSVTGPLAGWGRRPRSRSAFPRERDSRCGGGCCRFSTRLLPGRDGAHEDVGIRPTATSVDPGEARCSQRQLATIEVSPCGVDAFCGPRLTFVGVGPDERNPGRWPLGDGGSEIGCWCKVARSSSSSSGQYSSMRRIAFRSGMSSATIRRPRGRRHARVARRR